MHIFSFSRRYIRLKFENFHFTLYLWKIPFKGKEIQYVLLLYKKKHCLTSKDRAVLVGRELVNFGFSAIAERVCVAAVFLKMDFALCYNSRNRLFRPISPRRRNYLQNGFSLLSWCLGELHSWASLLLKVTSVKR